MKKIKFVLPAASLLAVAGLVSCGGSNRDVKPEYNISFANCYVKDRTDAYSETPENERVFPDWAYTNSVNYKGDELSDYDIGYDAYETKEGYPFFNYIRSGDKSNDGDFIVSGNTTFQVGEEINITLTLGDFVTLNPIDGAIKKTEIIDPDTEEPTGDFEYSIVDPVYFKIYVAESTTRSYNELELGEQYTLEYNEGKNVVNFHIPAKFVRYSYKVYFSASYLDASSFNFRGFNTLPYSVISGTEGDTSEFEKSVPYVPGKEEFSGTHTVQKLLKNRNYKMTNSRVGKDLACLIYPNGMSGGASFTPEYLSRLAFYGVKMSEEDPRKPVLKDITEYVHTNLVHYYANVSNIQNDILLGKSSMLRPVSTNEYACRATLPWVNLEHPEGGVFAFNASTGQYTLNYNYIGVNVKEAYKTEKVPFYADHTEIMTKLKVNPEAKSIEKAEISYEYVDGGTSRASIYVPALKIKVTAKDGFALNQIISSLKITSNTTTNGDKYFKDLTIAKEEDVYTAFNTERGYYGESTDYCCYSFNGTWQIEIDKTDEQTANVYISLPGFLAAIAYGPDSYSYYLDPITLDSLSSNSFDSTVTLDMVNSIEFGVYADDMSKK